ncbi:MAG: hypothetical protein WAT39_17455 [Planctomycetota bacterium]
MSKLLVALFCCAAATAQIPFGHLVYVNRTASNTTPAMGIVDPVFGTVTPIVPVTGALTQHGSKSVTVDPQAPNVLYSITGLSTTISAAVPVLTLTGNRFVRTNLTVNLGVPGLPSYVRWAPGYGLLLMGRGGQVNRMFLRNMGTGVVTPQPTPTMLPDFACDMCWMNGKAYGLSEGDSTATATSTIIEWDLATNTDRVVGTGYPPFFAMTGFLGALLCGDATGTLYSVDPVSGLAAPFLPTGLGKITSIASDGVSKVFVVAENGAAWSIHDVFTPGPALYSSSVAVDDLILGPTAVATMLSFGSGCLGSTSATPVLGFTAAPALGTTFAVTLNGALPGALVALVFGSSRVADPFGPLPRDLGLIGMAGCTQYTDLGGMLATFATATGTAQMPFTLPPNPALAGTRPPVQWLCLDALANPLGATTSSGGELYVY